MYLSKEALIPFLLSPLDMFYLSNRTRKSFNKREKISIKSFLLNKTLTFIYGTRHKSVTFIKFCPSICKISVGCCIINQTEPTTFAILLFWAFFRGFFSVFFIYFNTAVSRLLKFMLICCDFLSNKLVIGSTFRSFFIPTKRYCKQMMEDLYI